MVKKALFFMAVALSPAPALAGGGSGSIGITLSIPTICEIDASIATIENGESGSIGSVRETCNSAEGYIVSARHRPLKTTENLDLRFGRDEVSLDQSGQSILARRTGPSLSMRELFLRRAEIDEPVVLSLSVTYL